MSELVNECMNESLKQQKKRKLKSMVGKAKVNYKSVT